MIAHLNKYWCVWACASVIACHTLTSLIPYHKYQIKPLHIHVFSGVCVTAITNRSQLFCLYQQNKSSVFKDKFSQVITHYNPNLIIMQNKRVGLFPETWLVQLSTNC